MVLVVTCSGPYDASNHNATEIKQGMAASVYRAAGEVFVRSHYYNSNTTLNATGAYCTAQVPIGCHPVLLASFESRAAR